MGKRKFKDPRDKKIEIKRLEIGGFLFRLFSFHIYFTNCPMRKRQRGPGNKQKNKLRFIRLKKLHEGKGCELCGKHLTQADSELHHIKPLSLYPQLKYEPNNLMLLCHDCHVGLHREVIKKSI